ncbi:MAG: hypothetical protein IT200_11590 [Thermoleophilia bacterium]|nr:hypothetical protein [Thermoleophilia bacterium]
MNIHTDLLCRVRRVVTSLGEDIHVGGDLRVAWSPDHSYYVLTGPDGTRALNPAHVVSVFFD